MTQSDMWLWYGRLVFVVLVLLNLTACGAASVRTDDQIGQSGQGKDRLELHLDENRKLIVDLGRDKDNVSFRLRHPDGWEVDYNVGRATGVQQAAIRAQLEAIAIEADKEGRKDLAELIRGLLPLLL